MKKRLAKRKINFIKLSFSDSNLFKMFITPQPQYNLHGNYRIFTIKNMDGKKGNRADMHTNKKHYISQLRWKVFFF